MNKIITLKARTKRNFTTQITDKYPEYPYIDLVWFYEPVKAGEVNIKWFPDAKEIHPGIIIKKYNGGYWTILTDQQ